MVVCEIAFKIDTKRDEKAVRNTSMSEKTVVNHMQNAVVQNNKNLLEVCESGKRTQCTQTSRQKLDYYPSILNLNP